MGRKLKTDYKEPAPVNIPNVESDIVNRINSYCNLLDIDRKDFILDLIEDKLKDLVLDNTEIKLDKTFYFNMDALKENGTVKATKINPIHERELIYMVKTVPNNIDTFKKEFRTFCSSEDNPSLHLGVNIITELDKDAKTLEEGLKDTVYIFSYDSQEDALEISLVKPSDNDIGKVLDMYLTTEQEGLKQRLLKENEERHALFNASVYNEDGTSKEEIDKDTLKEFLTLMDSQNSYFTSFKGMKDFKRAFVEMYSKDIENPIIKDFLEKFKEF